MAIYILLVGLLFNFVVGLVVLINNPTRRVNVLLFLLSIFLGFWQISNYLADTSTDLTLFWNRATFIGPLLALMLFYLFIEALQKKPTWSNKTKLLSITTIVFAAASVASSLVIDSVRPRIVDNQITGIDVERGWLYFLVIGWILALIVISLVRIYAGYKNSKKQLQKQFKLIMFALVAAGTVGLFTNVVLPVLTGTTDAAKFAPLTSIIFYGIVAFAIVKHGLLNVKLAIARSIGYLLSILSVALVFVFSAFLAVNFLTDDDLKLPQSQQVIFTLIAVALAFVFQPVKTFFDKLSNTIFYRDAYDPQEFLDELNKVLVTKVDIEPLLTETVEVIKTHLKSAFCAFNVRKTQYLDNRLIGDDKKVDSKELEEIGKLTSHIHASVIVTDELESEHDDLRELLKKNDIALVARLVTTVEYDVEGVGFLMFGPKRSGSPYGHQDVKIIEIIANELVIAVQNALRFEEIEEFNVTLQQKVDEATKKLRNTNKKLEEMDQTKDEFISMASHQLRTPLTSVKGYLSMVLEGDAGEIKPMQERLLSQAYTSSQRMVYLIADLLNVSRLRTGKFVIEPIRSNLADVVEGEVNQLKETAASRKLEIVYEKPQNFPDLMLDETKVRQVVMNFIDNAIYYTPSGGTITVELKDKEDAIEYTVTDTGMGVPKADQQHLFTKFYRAGNARKARPDGTGLGLFMAKKVIVEQGGAVIFKSKEGEGSTFGFTFPKDKLTPKESVKKDTDKST